MEINIFLTVLNYNSASIEIFEIPNADDIETFIKQQGFNLDETSYMISYDEPEINYN